MKRVEFFFDLTSPYSYLAATQIDELAQVGDAEVVWRPFLLGGVIKAVAGGQRQSESPAKLRYMLADLQRWAGLYSVELKFSRFFPANTVKALRLVLVAEHHQPGLGRQLAKAAFQAMWVQERDLAAEETLRALATEVGLDADAAMKAIEEPAIKDELRQNTEEAVARGAFGAPSMFIGEQLFWGNDRLELRLKTLLEQPAA